MNKKVKYLIITINIIMIALAFLWYLEGGEKEPLIVILGQIIALLVLLFEKNISKYNYIESSKNSTIEINNISNTDSKNIIKKSIDSKIDVKN